MTACVVASAKQGKMGVLAVLVAGILWGTTGTTQALAPEGVAPLDIGLIRLGIGGAVLLGIGLLRGGLSGVTGLLLSRWTLLAALGMAAFQVSFFEAVSQTGVAVGTVVAIGSAPVLAGILGRIWLGETLSNTWWGATGLCVAGCILLSLGGGTVDVRLTGVFLAALAGLSYALVGFGMKRIEGDPSDVEKVGVVLSLGALLLLPLSLVYGPNLAWIGTPHGGMIALHLGIGTGALPFLLFGMGLRQIPMGKAYTLALSEPLTACVLGIFLLGERLPLPSIGGLGLLFGGLLLLASDGSGTASVASDGRSECDGRGD